MAVPATRETLKQYSLRALGKPVIEINVDDDQLEDRIDEAVQYFQQYHYDGIRRTYLKYKLTAADKTRLSALNTEEDIYVSDVLPTSRVMVKDEDLCLHCGLCAERCPTGAWDMQKFFYMGAQSKDGCSG